MLYFIPRGPSSRKGGEDLGIEYINVWCHLLMGRVDLRAVESIIDRLHFISVRFSDEEINSFIKNGFEKARISLNQAPFGVMRGSGYLHFFEWHGVNVYIKINRAWLGDDWSILFSQGLIYGSKRLDFFGAESNEEIIERISSFLVKAWDN